MAGILTILNGLLSSATAFRTQVGFENSAGDSASMVVAPDSVEGSLPLAGDAQTLNRPRFETVHLVAGFGVRFSNYSDLDGLGIDEARASLPLSIYLYIPFKPENPSAFFMGGWEPGNKATYKALLFYQSPAGLLAGVGLGKTWYSYSGDDLNGNYFELTASQGYPLFGLGYNLSPKRGDFLVTFPLASPLTTTFEDNKYTIRPAGIQFSLLLSLR